MYNQLDKIIISFSFVPLRDDGGQYGDPVQVGGNGPAPRWEGDEVVREVDERVDQGPVSMWDTKNRIFNHIYFGFQKKCFMGKWPPHLKV